MNREDLIRILNSEPMKFTYAEIEQMMDEELQKDPSEMDTDFVDLCAETLCNALSKHTEKESETDKTENKKCIKIKLGKMLAVAIIVTLILGVAVPAAAKYIDNDTSDKIVQFYIDHFSINLRNGETEADKHSDENVDLVGKLKESGFDNVVLPTVLLEDNYTYTVDVTEDNDYISAVIYFENQYDNKTITTHITKHKNGFNNLLISETQITEEYDSAKQLSLNGMDILVFGNKEISSIIYVDNNTDYCIVLNNYNFDSAVEIAESIK